MIRISQVGIRYMVIFAAYIEGLTTARTEDLNPASKLGREVEVSCLEHGSVEIKKSASGGEERLDTAIVYPIHLRTNGTATSAVGILTSFRMPGVSDHRHWDDLGNPANGEWAARVYQPTITALYLVQSTIHGIRECVLVCELAAKPGTELIQRRSVLGICGTDEKNNREKRAHHVRKVAGTEPAIKRNAWMRFNYGDHAL